MVCLGNEHRQFCSFWDCTQVLHLGLKQVSKLLTWKKSVVRKVNCNAKHTHTHTHTHRWGKPEGCFHLVKEQVRKMDLGFRHVEWWETCYGNKMTCNLCASDLHKLLRQFVMHSNSQGLWFYHRLSEIAFCGPAAAKTTMATHDWPSCPGDGSRSLHSRPLHLHLLPEEMHFTAEESSISKRWIWGWHLRIVQAF